MPSLELCLLGPPTIKLDHQISEVAKQKALALLAYLAVTRTQHRRDRLATLFWPDYDQSSARTYLRQALYELTQRLGEQWFTTSRELIGMAVTPELQVDVQLFLDLITIPNKTTDEISLVEVEHLQKAVTLYHEDFLAGFTLPDCPDFDEWQFFQTEQLRQQLAEALQKLINWYTNQGKHQPAIDYARRWLSLEPLQEAAHRTLMALYAAAGQSTNALHQYEECVRLLTKDLDAPPDQETTALYEAIKTKRFSVSVRTVQPAKVDIPLPENGKAIDGQRSWSVAANLPMSWSPLIGREHDLVALDHFFADANVRLITLVGPGGMGKTRLAIAVAEQQHKAERFPNGVHFVALAPLSDSESIVPAVAEALAFAFESGGKETRSPKRQLLDYLRHKRLLLVLDNFEHLLTGVGLVLEILHAAPEVKLLATSRERLQMHDEQVYLVHGLAYPQAKQDETTSLYAAGTLFHQRARRVQPDFELTPADAIPLARICHLVEGMPLGIELAASWVSLLPLTEIANEIERGLDFLTTEVRDVPARHRSLRAVFDATWQRLTATEQLTFAQLSIFRGGFTRQATQQVTGATLILLSALATKALVQFDKPKDRYNIHELLRQYGVSKLSEQPEQEQIARNRHSAHYCAWLQQRESELKGAKQRGTLIAIELEHENVRVAWQWALTYQHLERISQAMDSLGAFYEWQGRYEEGDALFQAAAETLEQINNNEARRLLAKALAWRTVFLRTKGPLPLAHQLLRQSLALLDDLGDAGKAMASVRAFVFLQMGHLALEQDNEASQSAYTQSLMLYRDLNAPSETAAALVGLGRVAQFLGDYHQVQTHYEESLVLYRRLGNHLGIATVLDALSLNARFQSRIEEGERLARESYEHYQQVGNPASLAKGLFCLGQAVDWMGRANEACALMQAAIDLYENLGHRRGLADLYVRISSTEGRLTQYAAARIHTEKGLTVAREFGDLRVVGSALDNLSNFAFVEGRYTEAEQLAQESLAAYQKLGVRAEEGQAYVSLAFFAFRRNDFSKAKEHFSQALHIGLKLPDIGTVSGALSIIAVFLAEAGDTEHAVELDALCQLNPMTANSSFYQKWIGGPIAAAALTNLSLEAINAAQARGRSFELWQTGAAWLEKLQSPGWPPR